MEAPHVRSLQSAGVDYIDDASEKTRMGEKDYMTCELPCMSYMSIILIVPHAYGRSD